MDQERRDLSAHQIAFRIRNDIADSSVGALLRPTEKQSDQARTENILAVLLAQGVWKRCSSVTDGVLESVSWLSNGTPARSLGLQLALTIRLGKAFRSIQTYGNSEQIALEMYRQLDLPVGLGTSFGFDVSRLYVTANHPPDLKNILEDRGWNGMTKEQDRALV